MWFSPVQDCADLIWRSLRGYILGKSQTVVSSTGQRPCLTFWIIQFSFFTWPNSSSHRFPGQGWVKSSQIHFRRCKKHTPVKCWKTEFTRLRITFSRSNIISWFKLNAVRDSAGCLLWTFFRYFTYFLVTQALHGIYWL